MTERTLRGQTAIVGIGETTYYRHGQSPDAEFKLALQAVVTPARMRASARMTSTASPPMAMTAARRGDWPRRLA